MSLSLYLSALRISRTSFVTWAIIILAYAFLVAYLYDSFKDMAGLEEYMSAIPEQMQAAIGIAGTETEAFSDGVMDPRFFLNTEYMAWLPLMLAIYAVFYCGGIVSREAERGTLDLLLSQPLARHKLVVSKTATFLSMAAALLVVSWIGIAIGLAAIGTSVDLGRVAVSHLALVPVILSFAGGCTLISCLYLDPRRSLAVAGGIIAGMFMLNFMAPSLGSFRWLENLSLFHHVDSLEVLLKGTVNWTGVAVHLSVAVATLGTALAVFERRDLSY